LDIRDKIDMSVRKRRSGLKGEERKEQILNAALKVFAQYGYEKTSIAKICDSIQIGRGTLYQYFKDKNTIFREILERYAERVQKILSSVYFSEYISSLEEFVYQRLLMVLREIYQNKELYMILLKEAPAKNAGVGDLVRSIRRRIIGAMASDLKLGNQLGLFKIADPELTAVLLVGGTMEAQHYYVFDVEDSADPEALAKKIAEFQVKVLMAVGS
jgi:AcrR family transcriptional regulator